MSETDDEVNDTYWRTQLYVALWPLWLVLFVPFIALSIAGLDGIPGTIELLALAPALVLVVATVVAHFGLIFDGRALGKSDAHTWRPWWIAYFLASWVIGVYLVAPVYLLRRRSRTGRPNRADVKRKLSLRGLLVPWH